MPEVKLPENKKVDYEIAEALGLAIKTGPYKGLYKALDGVNPTLFTSPPSFSGSADLLEAAAVKLLAKLVPKEGLRADLTHLSTKELVEELRKREGIAVYTEVAPYAAYTLATEEKIISGSGPVIVIIVED